LITRFGPAATQLRRKRKRRKRRSSRDRAAFIVDQNSERYLTGARLAFAHDQHASAIIVAADPLTGANNREFVERRISLKLPAIHTFPFEAKSGALISYGIDIEENYLRIAEYADRLLKAQKIADLPFQNPRG